MLAAAAEAPFFLNCLISQQKKVVSQRKGQIPAAFSDIIDISGTIRKGMVRKVRIAICDDEISMVRILEEKIKRLLPDAAIDKYLSGDALIASGCRPDILFLDIQMSGTDGMETAKILRKDNEAMLLVFVTAAEEYVFQAFDVGAFHYLVKPFSDIIKFIVIQDMN